MEDGSRTGLVLALGHELGNLIGAVRLQAHLLDAEMSARDLAIASVELDDLAGRSAALLAMLRPLVSPVPEHAAGCTPEAVVDAVCHAHRTHGGRGIRFDVEVASGLPAVRVEQGVLQSLLTGLLYSALESAERGASVALRVEAHPRGVAFALEDDSVDVEDPALWREQAPRGRTLICAVADTLLTARGGLLEVHRVGNRTRVALVAPHA